MILRQSCHLELILQSGSQLDVSGMLGVIAEGGETPDSAGDVLVSSTAECTGGGEQAAPLSGLDTAAAVSIPKEGSVPRVCVGPLFAKKTGVDGKRVLRVTIL